MHLTYFNDHSSTVADQTIEFKVYSAGSRPVSGGIQRRERENETHQPSRWVAPPNDHLGVLRRSETAPFSGRVEQLDAVTRLAIQRLEFGTPQGRLSFSSRGQRLIGRVLLVRRWLGVLLYVESGFLRNWNAAHAGKASHVADWPASRKRIRGWETSVL
jgi:hypothetical protein